MVFDNVTEETIYNDMINNIPSDVDTREGSIIYNALMPIAMELSDVYSQLGMVYDEVFADTASYAYLAKRAAERGLYPEDETKATLKMVVTPASSNITIGDVFILGELSYTVTSEIDKSKGEWQVECDTAGIIGNSQLGDLLPAETSDELNDLEEVELTEVLIPGQDEEDEETFRLRYFESFTDYAFSGNKQSYKDAVNSIDGVGSCKVIRQWDDGYDPKSLQINDDVTNWISKQSADTVGTNVYTWLNKIYTASKNNLLTTGGTIKIIIATSDYKAPSGTLIATVQNALDPNSHGEGEGIAPIGHAVKVEGCISKTINYSFKLVYVRNYNFDKLKTDIESAIDEYHAELSNDWADADETVIRTSFIETKLLAITGIADITEIQINGSDDNLILNENELPVRGDVSEIA